MQTHMVQSSQDFMFSCVSHTFLVCRPWQFHCLDNVVEISCYRTCESTQNIVGKSYWLCDSTQCVAARKLLFNPEDIICFDRHHIVDWLFGSCSCIQEKANRSDILQCAWNQHRLTPRTLLLEQSRGSKSRSFLVDFVPFCKRSHKLASLSLV